MSADQQTYVHIDVSKADKARWVKSSQRRSTKLGDYLSSLIALGDAHQRDALEALRGMGQGLPQYNKGVLIALGYHDLWLEWDFACQQHTAALEKRKEAEGEDYDMMAPPPLTPELREAQRQVLEASNRMSRAWEPIEALRQRAIDGLDLDQWLP